MTPSRSGASSTRQSTDCGSGPANTTRSDSARTPLPAVISDRQGRYRARYMPLMISGNVRVSVSSNRL